MTAIAFPLLLGLATAGQSPGEQRAPRRIASPHPRALAVRATATRPGKDTTMKLIRLRSTTTAAITQTIRGLMHDVDIAVDRRTNTLIVVGGGEAVSRVESLVEALDVPDLKQKSFTEVMELRGVHGQFAQQQLERILRAEGPLEVSINADGRSNKLLVSGTRDQIQRVRDLIAKLDRAATKERSFFVQIYCLIEGDDDVAGDSDLGFPGGTEVANELSRLGIRNASLLFKTLARVEGRSEFQITGSAARGQRVEVSGEVIESTGDSVKMSLQMSLARPGGDEACDIRTTVRAPLGDQVIIGAAPHEGATVVLVVRVVAQ